MRRGNHDVAGDVDLVVSDKETRKHTITEQRREQNRRAQRVFRKSFISSGDHHTRSLGMFLILNRRLQENAGGQRKNT